MVSSIISLHTHTLYTYAINVIHCLPVNGGLSCNCKINSLTSFCHLYIVLGQCERFKHSFVLCPSTKFNVNFVLSNLHNFGNYSKMWLILSYFVDTKIDYNNILTCTVILRISVTRFRIYHTVSAVRVSLCNFLIF